MSGKQLKDGLNHCRRHWRMTRITPLMAVQSVDRHDDDVIVVLAAAVAEACVPSFVFIHSYTCRDIEHGTHDHAVLSDINRTT